jgi:Uma2 family endonuclease
MSAIAAVAALEPANVSIAPDAHYEVIDGRIQETPRMGAFETTIASILQAYLGAFAMSNDLGLAVTETLFVLDADRLRRRPDVAYVSYDRWPHDRQMPRTEAWDVVPDLAVEVVSPSNTAEEILGKIRDYFDAGVRRVWVIYPTEEQIYVYRSTTQNDILTSANELDGEDVVPGFRLPIAKLFVLGGK